MPELEKLVISALNSGSLEPDPHHEAAIDRVMAFALAAIHDPLGAALLRLKFLGNTSAYETAVTRLIARVVRPGENRRAMKRVCERVLDEWYYDLCQVCSGRGGIVADGTPLTRHVCPSCSGSGRQPVSIQGRCSYLGVSPTAYPRWRPRLDRAEGAVGRAERDLMEELAVKLGRVSGRPGAGKRFALALVGIRSILPGSSSPAHNDNTMPESSDA